MRRSLRRLGSFLKKLSKDSFKAAFYVVAVPTITCVLLILVLRFFNLYLDVRETIIEVGKAAHLVVKKPNALTLKIGHSDSAVGLQDEYELTRGGDGCAGVWFAVVNPEEDETYDETRLFIRFDEPNANKVSMKSGDGWQMFKQGHFNFGFPEPILAGYLVQTAQIEFCFAEIGKHPFHYVLYADGYRRSVGTRLIVVK